MQNIFETPYHYHGVRDIIINELKNHTIAKEILPIILPDKSGISIIQKYPSLRKDKILESIKIIKNQIENIRIHSADDSYLCLQALNDNIYDTSKLIDNIKFRFFSGNSPRLEISKNQPLKSNEIQSIVELIVFLHQSTQNQQNPDDLLASMNVVIFHQNKGNTIHFNDLAGYGNVKEEIIESIILPLKNPSMFKQISTLTRKIPIKNIPRAILFEGEPGVGKTSFAKAAATMAGIPLIYIPVETILSKYYGESAKRLAYIFELIENYPSAITFLDEIDSLVGNREDGMFEATRNVLSVLLRKLDGSENKMSSILIAATNRKNDLDSALISRFDRSINFPLPDSATRAAILSLYAKHLSNVEKVRLAEKLENFSGRSIRDFCDFVERKWAVRIIEQDLPVSPPDSAFYEELTGRI